ncbi:MAG: hypothetical protein ACLRLD_06140 [Lachnospira sp.]
MIIADIKTGTVKINGVGITTMAELAMIISALHENGYTKADIEPAIDAGFMSEDELKNSIIEKEAKLHKIMQEKALGTINDDVLNEFIKKQKEEIREFLKNLKN